MPKMDMYIRPTAGARASAIGVYGHILREASANLFVLLYRAIPEPPFVRTSKEVRFSRILFVNQSNAMRAPVASC